MSDGGAAQGPIPKNIAEVTGPLLMGYLLNYGLYGVVCVQTYIYYTAFPNDKRIFRSLVYSVFAIDTIQTAMITYDAFQSFGYGYGNLDKLGRIGLLWLDLCFCDGIIAFMVQSYYAYRIRLLSDSKILLPGAIFITAFIQLVGAITAGSLAATITYLSELRDRCFVGSIMWLAGSATCDVLIAISMAWVLSRKNSSYKETQDLIRRIIILTMETGSLTALAATADLIIFMGFPQLDVHITFTLTLAKLYSNSLLVSLNARVKIPGSRGYKGNSPFVTNGSSDWNFTSIGLSSTSGRSRWDTRTGDSRGTHGENAPGAIVITQQSITWDDSHHDNGTGDHVENTKTRPIVNEV
ncbi:hypothetical protein PM082_006476 [Marasmius tenuissimus]|nr:hypothetical protein PM082_006476 [Marasmius tenuissimus]